MSDQASAVVTRSWSVPSGHAKTRLDTFVRHCLPHLSRREVERAIAEKLFRINDQVGEKGDKLSPSDHVTFKGVAHWLLNAPRPQSQLRVPIVYEDMSVLVVDKPAGMATHGFSGHDQGTLANFLAAERPDLLIVGKSRWEPGLVHRLDRETSGLVLVAKTQAAFDDLRLQFRQRQVRKKYWALVWGITEAEGVVALSITHDSHDKRRMRALSDTSRRPKKQKSWPALTRYQKLWDINGLSFLEIAMETGVTHQIRVHLAAIGHSIIGDLLYGGPRCEKFSLERHFLHAHGLEFFHPEDHQLVKVESKLPSELEAVVRGLQTMR